MSSSARRIHVKGPYRQEEAKAAEAGIYPGMLCELDSDGYLIKHDDEGGALGDEVLIAMEDALRGRNVSTVYASGDIVTYMIPQKGCVANVLIEAGQDIAVADKVCSSGNGCLIETTEIGSDESLAAVVGMSQEDLDLSATGAVNTLGQVRF